MDNIKSIIDNIRFKTLDLDELRYLNSRTYAQLIVNIVKFAYRHSYSDIADILNFLVTNNEDEEFTSVYTYIFEDLTITDKEVQYLFANKVNSLIVADRICSGKSSSLSIHAIRKCIDNTKITAEQLEYLYDRAISADNDDCSIAIKEYFAGVTLPVEQPSYCINVPKNTAELIASLPQPEEDQVDLDTLAIYLTGIKQPTVEYEEKLLEMRNRLDTYSEEQIDNLQYTYFDLWKGADNEEIARILGPVNKFQSNKDVDYEFDCDFNTYCAVYGGCRMMTCCHIDSQPWFTGICRNENCKKSISKPQYAIRKKGISGRCWQGCYCSVKCAKDSPLQNSNNLMAVDTCKNNSIMKNEEDSLIDETYEELTRVGLYVPTDTQYYPYVYEGDL